MIKNYRNHKGKGSVYTHHTTHTYYYTNLNKKIDNINIHTLIHTFYTQRGVHNG